MLVFFTLFLTLGESRQLLASEIAELCDENPWDTICENLRIPEVTKVTTDYSDIYDEDEEDPFAGLEKKLDNNDDDDDDKEHPVADFYSAQVDKAASTTQEKMTENATESKL